MMMDSNRVPETPSRGAHHRRAQSETFFRFPEDILLDDSVADFDLSSLDLLPPMPVESESSNGAGKSSGSKQPGPSSLLRSASVDADFFEGLGLGGGVEGGDERFGTGKGPQRGHHRHSNSMDGSSATSFDSVMMMDNGKKSVGADKLAELSLIDPKRAKRVLANRQSAARSKERKVRYTSDLERRVQTLQTEATTLSAQVTILQRDTSGLTIENRELQLRLQAMEQQARLRDALNETLRDEVQRLKIASGEVPAANGNSFNRGLPPQYNSRPQSFHHFGNHQMQQVQQQPQFLMPNSTSNSIPPRNVQPVPSFADFNQRV